MANEPNVETQAPQPPPAAPNGPAAESAGVEGLIGRLRDAGIAKGQEEAGQIVAAAKQQAAELIANARKQAEEIVVRGKEEQAKLKVAAEDALRLATRDAILGLESDLIDRFQNMLSRLVKDTLEEPAFLQKLILEVAGRSAPRARHVEVLLPSTIVTLDELMKKPESAKPGTLMHFVLSAGGGLLREGVTFGSTDQIENGIRVKLTGEDMHVELTANAVGEFLLQHMLPRFRALLRGAVVTDAATPPQPQSRTHPMRKAS